jgi:hypothetical protein
MKRYLILIVLSVVAFVLIFATLPTSQPATIIPTITPAPTLQPPPAQLPQTDSNGKVTSYQEGPLWVLISGVDEHGLLQERRVPLLSDADAAAESGQRVRTGSPAAVYEIRVSGPQNLRRFYRVRAVSGESGWVSDYYIRRRAFLYNDQGERVPVYGAPDGEVVAQAANVSQVTLIDPTQAEWWQVAGIDGSYTGWVPVSYIKESSEREFLLVQQYLLDDEEEPTPQHSHQP